MEANPNLDVGVDRGGPEMGQGAIRRGDTKMQPNRDIVDVIKRALESGLRELATSSSVVLTMTREDARDILWSHLAETISQCMRSFIRTPEQVDREISSLWGALDAHEETHRYHRQLLADLELRMDNIEAGRGGTEPGSVLRGGYRP